MKKIVILVLLAQLVTSCFIGSLYSEEDYWFAKGKTQRFLEIEDLVVLVDSTSREFDFSIDAKAKRTYSALNPEDAPQFNALLEKYGDMNYNQKLLKYDGQGCFVPDVVGIQVVSDREFDADHPAGSSLNDCFSLKLYSFYLTLDNKYYLNQPHLYNSLLTNVGKEELMMIAVTRLQGAVWNSGYSGYAKLTFKKLAEKLETHNFTFVITDENGTKYSSTIEYDFSQCLLAGKE